MEKRINFIIYTVLFVVLIILSLWVIKPFILSIIAGVIIAYIFYPVYKWLLKHIKGRGWSAFIVTLLIILIFTVPFLILIQTFAKDAYVSYIIIKQKAAATLFVGEKCAEKTTGCAIANWIGGYVNNPQSKFYFDDMLGKVSQWAVSKANDIIVQIPEILLQILVMMFVIYYSLKDGEKLIKKVPSVLPLRKKHYETLVKKTKEMIGSTIYGMLVVAAIQGACAGIGYFIFGVKSPVLLGLLTMLAALVPVVGTALVWGPVVIVYFLDSLLSNNSMGIVLSLGLLAYSLFPVSTIDNLIRPKIIGDRAKVHPILILLGVMGGIAAFGIVGLLIGPIIITLFVVFIDIYEEERRDHEIGS